MKVAYCWLRVCISYGFLRVALAPAGVAHFVLLPAHQVAALGTLFPLEGAAAVMSVRARGGAVLTDVVPASEGSPGRKSPGRRSPGRGQSPVRSPFANAGRQMVFFYTAFAFDVFGACLLGTAFSRKRKARV